MNPIACTPGIEVVQDGEARLSADIVAQMAASSRCTFERHRHALRDAHAKSNGILKGTLTVHAGLAPALAFGTIARYKLMLGLLEANAHAPDTLQRLVAGTAHGAKEMLEAFGGHAGATLDGLVRANHHPPGETYHTQAAQPRIEPGQLSDIPD